MSPDEKRAIMSLAIGRLLRIMSRPAQDGDHDEYTRIRSIILDQHEQAHGPLTSQYVPNYVRDQLKGAQGD